MTQIRSIQYNMSFAQRTKEREIHFLETFDDSQSVDIDVWLVSEDFADGHKVEMVKLYV